ncbi:hypothetical protein ACMXZD_12065, partial [Pasteurella multocida]
EFQDKYGFTDSSELEGFKKDTYKHRDVAGWLSFSKTVFSLNVIVGENSISFADNLYIFVLFCEIDHKIDFKSVDLFNIV